ncbi:MAG: glycoside hydrolase family 92 protein [Tessaracoccus sp.]|uniref:glycoside hydrolase domain-containing protein n=1 Tax=Tessaracoccus sp. TaxID=1971211 RepID=UPI001EB2A299|nr:glycoside hydrolase domain-containing protein [Tessaracoccus sp.]MBK7820221.1 glycoside hydrolase family 92 protein [Tessaracoccus sp.]
MIPELRPHRGPEPAPAAAPETGLWSADCLRYLIEATTEHPHLLEWATPLVGVEVAEGDVLEWAVFPAYDHAATAWPDGFRACGTGIEVAFDDDSTVGADADEVDGLPADAAARRGIDWPDQWNHRRLDLSAWAGRRIREVRLVVDPGPAHGDTADELLGWVDGPRLTAPQALSDSPAERVLTTRGSHSSPRRSRGLTQPLTGVPHGGCYLTPATSFDHQAWAYSWSAHSVGTGPRLAGLLITRSPSVWIGDRGPLGIRIGLELDEDGRAASEPFSHDDELALPHRYRVRTASGVQVDGAAASDAVLAEIAFPAAGFLQLTVPGGRIEHVTVEGQPSTSPSSTSTIRLAVRSDGDPETALTSWYEVSLGGADVEEVPGEGPTFRVAPHEGAALRIEVGASFISQAQAGYAKGAVEGIPLDEVARTAERAWNSVLAVVEAPEASADDARAVASDLYRLFCYPTFHHEQTPDGPRYADPVRRLRPDTATETGREVHAGSFLTDHGFWDTYRTCWPAFHLLAPALAGELVDGFLEHFRVGDWSARWSAGVPVDCMVGTSLDIVTADAVTSGIEGFDLFTAYRSALRNATAASPEAHFGRADLPATLFRGYTSAAIEESVSWTLEGAINDAGAAVLARELARRSEGAQAARYRAEARYLAGRALDYDRLLDTDSLFFRPREASGAFADEPFDPRIWGGGHTETNAWGSRFLVHHDGAGLARLFGGPSALGEALDELFAEPETALPEFSGTYSSVIHEMSEARDLRLGMCGLSNQPAHHVPWTYAFTDRPWRAAEVVEEALGRLFLGMHIGQGFPGDEDNGEMSAWHLFGLMGLYPLQVGSGEFLIGVPRQPVFELTPIGAPPLTIRAVGEGRYVGGVVFNGSPWRLPTIPTSVLHEGGTLEVQLSPVPVDWCAPMPEVPFFAPDDAPALAWRNAVAEVRELDLALDTDAEGLVQLTVTLDEPGRGDLTVLAWHEGVWLPVAQFGEESWDWPCQTRPFDVVLPTPTRRLRVEWSGQAAPRQIQVLVPRDRIAAPAPPP